jgi:hypothetical protein
MERRLITETRAARTRGRIACGAAGEAGIRVQDAGSGIPAEQLRRVFERYHTGSPGGAGIGLSRVSASAGAMAGRSSWKAPRGGHDIAAEFLTPCRMVLYRIPGSIGVGIPGQWRFFVIYLNHHHGIFT